MSKIREWKTISSTYLYQSKWLKIRFDDVIQPNGERGTYEVVERNKFVLVIPKVGDTYYMVEQYRYPVKSRSLEFPMGGMIVGEDPAEAARRELEEETGLKTKKLRYIGFFHTANGHNTQGCMVYLAEDCTEGTKKLDATEGDMVTKIVSHTELKELIKNNTITDGPTISAFCFYLMSQ